MSNKTAISILIQADDQASKKLADVAKNTERSVARIKDVGGKAKASTEFIGSIASAFGGSELGAAAGQVAGLTEKISAFSEVSKAGAGGALAFKLGLAGLSFGGGLKVGQWIGSLAHDTERWKKEMVEASKQAEDLNRQMVKSMSQTFDSKMFDASLLRDPEKQAKEQEFLFGITQKNLKGVRDQLASSEKSVEEYKASWASMVLDEGYLKQLEDKVEQDKQRVAVLEQQESILERIVGTEAKRQKQLLKEHNSESYILQLREQLKLEQASNEERQKLGLTKIVIESDTGEALKLLQQIEDAKKANVADAKGKEQVEALTKQLQLAKAQTEEASKLRLLREGTASQGLNELLKLKAGMDDFKLSAEDALKFKVDYTFETDNNQVDELNRQLELLQSETDQVNRLKLEQEGLSGELLEQALTLQKQVDEQEKLRQLEKDRIDNAKRLGEVRASEIEQLRMMAIEQLKGKEAVEALRLQEAGFSKDEAGRVASLREKLTATKPEDDEPRSLTATVSRTLLRGPRDDMQSKQLDAQKENTKMLQDVLKELEGLRSDQASFNRDDKSLKVKVVR